MSTNPDETTDFEQTALLMHAIDHKSVDVVKEQLALGALVDAQCISPDFEYNEPSCDGPCGWRPLQRATFKHRPEVVECLLQHGADVNSSSFKESKYSAIRLAVRAHKDVRKNLKQDQEGKGYYKGYYRGLVRDYTQIIRLLLEHRADRSGVASHRIVSQQMAKVRWGKVREHGWKMGKLALCVKLWEDETIKPGGAGMKRVCRHARELAHGGMH